MTAILRITGAGLVLALVVGLAGWGLERRRFGESDDAARARVERELADMLDASADTLAAVSARVTGATSLLHPAARDLGATRALFERVSAALQNQDLGRTGITVYGDDGSPVAWAGRVFDLPKERLSGSASLFVAPSAMGPRLVRVEPIDARLGVVVVERTFGTRKNTPGGSNSFVITTSLAPVQVRAHLGGTPPAGPPLTFTVPSRSGLSIEAELSASDLAIARARWRGGTWAAVLGVFATTLLLTAGPILELRRRTRSTAPFLIETVGVAAILLAALILLLVGIQIATGAPPATTPAGLLVIALAAMALVVMALDLAERRRVAAPRPRLLTGVYRYRVAVLYMAAGAAGAIVLGSYEQILRGVVANTRLDVLHFSILPLAASRVAVAFALVLLDAAAIWGSVFMARFAAGTARLTRNDASRWIAISWTAGAAVAALMVVRVAPSVPFLPLCVALAAGGGCAVVFARLSSRLRRASQAARLGVLLLALLVPALAFYPSLFAFLIAANDQRVSSSYGPEALSLREDLQRRVQQAVDEIDSVPLNQLVAGADATPTTDRAFLVWSQTDLAKYRLTSAVELYDAEGNPVSRFALHLPEYTTNRTRATTCTWEPPIDEVSPFGSNLRNVLRTSRGICDRGRVVGTIVVRVMLDYKTLSFLSSQSSYLGSLQQSPATDHEGLWGRDIEFVVYGWSRAPIFESGTGIWTLSDDVFQRLVQSRQPFWQTIERGDETFRVYFLNDRRGIYALGYPMISWAGQVINLAELALLAFVLYLALIAGAMMFSTLTGRTPATGRELLREVRSSFYRKLFLAFVAGTVVPVFILALAIRTYFARQISAGATEAAQRTVTTAQRLVEDYAAIAQAGSTSLSSVDDQIMLLVRRAINEDVNLFDRGRLQATSARDLFASLVLSPRTPGDVYESILLDHAPTFVGDEAVGDLPYTMAAAPVRAEGREGIVTVLLTNRRKDIEQQTDELDRRVRASAVLFSLLGAAIGYWAAERIADPVNRLTRATTRIARGDLDARIAATSSDELRRLVEHFNQMADDLKRRRAELERTQRLEAWADMARQVAHDIKNPLTPIQLSAEHVRRVNIDRGRPLSPAVDECVNAILGQVRLLRQIAGEFSSFASSPTPRPEPTPVQVLVEEVIEPYRTGLVDRITIDVRAPVDGLTAMIDRTLFARAMTNIVENALHAMPGSGRLMITMRRASTGGAATAHAPLPVVVEIADTGVGMDEEAARRIFEPYFSTKASGTGLGLTIAKRNVELNGGRIEVRSQRGSGTTVTIVVPGV